MLTNLSFDCIIQVSIRGIPRKREVAMVITFAGHSFIASSDEVKKRVKEEICKHVENGKQISCYLGGYGDFDQICARACRELKREYGNIELVYVTPYLRPSEQ